MTLKGLRANVNMTQDAVAKYLGISRQSWRNKEKGLNKLTFEEGFKLSDLFKVSIEDIYQASRT